MGNSDKETVAEMPVPAVEPAQNNETAPTGSTPAVADTISAPTETTAAEATRSLEGPSAMSSALPPTYEDIQKESITAPPAAAINSGDPIEAARVQPTYPSYDEKVAMNAQVPPADPHLTPLERLYDESKLISCPFCYQQAMTKVTKESTGSTSMAAVACCLFGGICCAFLPYCMEMCHDAHHFCSQCGKRVALVPHDAPVQVFSPSNPGIVAVEPRPIQAPEAVMKN
ncbi:LPS-induced tumor necrosis factor alpha factor [Penicillium brevicompactum]|uniref:LPS-induced tumor necrosis factor alpha factor n=1 Tax=Penicillium brevicompactum TaxID=5074 RepID=A0A9W9QAU3_PENBR|nr:LPS-induced tumor necrosis factor alpha factor [Penicillium brevicompactum]